MSVYIIHENDAWIPPFRKAFDELNLPYIEWNLSESHSYSLNNPPDPNSIYFNRISPSSHTRNHRYSCEITSQVLDYLSLYNSRIINDQRALSLELSKVKQYAHLTKAGIRVPKTAFVGNAPILNKESNYKEFIEKMKSTARDNFYNESTKEWTPFISKHNRAGKGLGVHLFFDDKQLGETLLSLLIENPNVEDLSVDGIYLLQEYIKSPNHVINRAEFIGYKMMYVIEVDTRQGFQLCPSDACRLGDAKLVKQSADEIKHGFNVRSKDSLNEKEVEVINKLENFLKNHDIEVAGIEYVSDGNDVYVYDVNCNTNYNVAAETRFWSNAWCCKIRRVF